MRGVGVSGRRWQDHTVLDMMVFAPFILPPSQHNIILHAVTPLYAVLGDEVTGIPGENDILDLALTAFWNRDRFVDVNKMI